MDNLFPQRSSAIRIWEDLPQGGREDVKYQSYWASLFLGYVPSLCSYPFSFSSDEETYGFALLPSLYANYPELDGMYIRFTSLPGGSSPYRQGSTVIHEAGHWLGLLHTFQVSIF